jgi:surface antigen
VKITSRRSPRLAAALVAVLALFAGQLTLGAASANAAGTVLCQGYAACEAAGMTTHGYPAASKTEYWRMVSGHNCTNYAAYMLIQAGMSTTRPWTGNGNATAWGYDNADVTDQTPAVGAIAWWGAGKNGAGSAGHVAYVESVTANSIRVSEDNYGGDFYWRVIYKTDAGWPTGFVHFKDASTSSSFPAWRARPLAQTAYADSRKTQSASITTIDPGTTLWMTLTYQNTGDQTWTGVQLKTAGATSAVSSPNWIAPDTPTSQKQTQVLTGATATFSFPVNIPVGVPDGTQLTETFTPVDSSGVPILLGATTLTFTADSRDHFVFEPSLGITGTAKQGKTLTAITGAWDPVQPVLTYQWLRDGKAISGATAETYTLKSADVGTVTSVAAIATADGYVPVSQSATVGSVTKSLYGKMLAKKQKLASSAQLVSSNGKYKLVNGKKGNLAVVNRFTNKTVWSSKKYSKGAYTKLRSDGVLVSYTKKGKAIWSTKTKGKKVTKAVITNSGKLVLYTAKNKVVWNSASKANK